MYIDPLCAFFLGWKTHRYSQKQVTATPRNHAPRTDCLLLLAAQESKTSNMRHVEGVRAFFQRTLQRV